MSRLIKFINTFLFMELQKWKIKNYDPLLHREPEPGRERNTVSFVWRGGGYLHQQTKNVRRKEENLGKLTRKIKVPLVLGNPNDLPVVWQHYRSFISRWRNKIPRAQCPWALQNWVKRTVFSVITANVTYKRDSVLQRTHEQCRYKSHDQPINPPDIIGSSSVTGNSEFQKHHPQFDRLLC